MGRVFISRVGAVATSPEASSSDREPRHFGAPFLTKTWKSHPVRVLALCGVVLGGAIVAATVILLSNLYNRAIADKGRELERIVLVLGTHVDDTFHAVSRIEMALLEQFHMRGINSAAMFNDVLSGYDVHLQLKDKKSNLSYVGTFSLISAQGKLVNWSRSWPIPEIDVSDRQFFQVLKSDDAPTTYMSELVRNRGNGSWTVHIVQKITGANGEFIGLILGAIEMPLLEGFFSTIANGPDAIVTLHSREGVLLARHPPTPDKIGTSVAGSILFKNVLANSHAGVTRLTSMIDGKDRLVAARQLSHYPAVVGVGTTVDATLIEWRKGAIYLVTAAILLIVLIGSAILLGARIVSARLREQNLRLDAALSNMSQGISMFDSRERLVVCNDRYIDMYKLLPALARSGCTLRDLLSHQRKTGNHAWNLDERHAFILAKVAENKRTTEDLALADGRTIRIVNHPLGDGGWVATHEDITDMKRREASFRLLFKSNPIPMWVYDVGSLQFLAVNEAAIAHYGYSAERFLAMRVVDIHPLEDRERFLRALERRQSHSQGEYASHHQKSDGTQIDVTTYAQSLKYEGRAARLVAAIDVTERKRAEEALKDTKAFLDTIVENVPVPLLVKEPRELRYILANRAAEQLLGLPRHDILGKSSFDLLTPDLADAVMRRDSKLLQSKGMVWTGEHPMQTPGNGLRMVTSKRVLVRDDAGEPQYLLGVLEDVTERKEAELRIAHMAHHDSLTDLPNRVLLRERLDQALARRGEQLAVFYLDIDHFKDVNDTLGHPVGDELLKVVAERLRDCVSDMDTVARLGGDEFAIIRAASNQPADAAELAKAIRTAIKAPFNLVGHQIVANISIGIAVAPHDGTTADQLLKNADLALYGAKAQGRDGHRFFEPEMEKRMLARREMESDLRKALVNSEFELHYQPLVSLESNEVTGVEALLRWRHPLRGMVSPAEFIPLAEEIGLIVPLGEWVLRRACADAASWPADIKIAINLSPAQLMNQSLLPHVVSALGVSGLSPRRLEFEITEAILMQNNEATVNALHQLRALGVRIAMDDFGTGYSSLSYLRSFPFDRIKIDQSFVKGLACDEGSLAIIRAIVTLARSLNMATTAEGVETELQREMLRVEGCTTMQGYLFSRAVPAAEVVQFFQPRKPSAVVAA